MESKKPLRGIAVFCVLMSALLFVAPARAEIEPGEVLDQSTWQEARGLMPDAILKYFELGQHSSKIITLPQEALRWSSRFNAATEANQGKYKVNEKEVLIEKATGSWPRFI